MGGVRVVGSRTKKGALLKGPSGKTGESCFSAFSNTSVPPECAANTLLPHTNLHTDTDTPLHHQFPPQFVHSFIFLLMTQRRETLCTHSKKHAHNCCHRQAHTETHCLQRGYVLSAVSWYPHFPGIHTQVWPYLISPSRAQYHRDVPATSYACMWRLPPTFLHTGKLAWGQDYTQ